MTVRDRNKAGELVLYVSSTELYLYKKPSL